jgi:signal transduction histidine kinase
MFGWEKQVGLGFGSNSSMLDKNGNLWYGVSDRGLYKVDLTTHQIWNYRDSDTRMTLTNPVQLVARGFGDTLLIGTRWQGVKAFSATAGRFLGTWLEGEHWGILNDHQGKIWIAQSAGLVVVDSATGMKERFVHDQSDPRSLSHTLTWSIFQDSFGRIWAGAGNTVDLWNPASRSFIHYNNPGFSDCARAYPLGQDRRGRLWVRTETGKLGVIDTATGKFNTFDLSEGLCNTLGDMENLEDGSVLLSGWAGWNIVWPDSIGRQRSPPPLLITNMKVNDRVLVPAPVPLGGTGSLQLSHTQDVLEFEFAAIDIDAPQLVRYSYRLEGLEPDWVKTQDRRYVRYTAVPPGTYVFRLRAASARDEWPEQEISLAIGIAPPWWRTWWFETLAVVGFLGLVLSVYRREATRIRRDKLTQQEFSRQQIESQEAERKRLAAELHDGLGQDLLVASNGLQQFLSDENASKADLAQAASLVQDSIQAVREISSNLHPHHLERLGFLAAIEAMTENLARTTGLAIDNDLDNIDGLLPKETEIHLYRIIQEALTNVVRHASARTVSVKVTKNPDMVEIAVTDDGKGFQALENSQGRPLFYSAERLHGFGLSSMSERARIIGGAINIKSSPGNGTTVHVTLPYQISPKQV